MKRLFYLLLIFNVFSFSGCQDDDMERFMADMPENPFSFTPIAGGAVMHYKLPADQNVVAVNLRYQDVYGNEILRTGSHVCDSLVIVGFNEEQHDISGEVTLCRYDGAESEPIPVTFSTLDSGPVSFIKSLEVEPSWNGFSVAYRDIPANVNGMAHVFYVGTNPYTQEIDTLLVNSFTIEEGGDTLAFQLQQRNAFNTVVVRTEDFRGYMVGQKVWENIESYNTGKFNLTENNVTYPRKSSLTDEGYASIEDVPALLGIKYLFDGDIKGETCWGIGGSRYKMFLAGPNAVGEGAPPMYLDLGSKQLSAELRVYCMLNTGKSFNTEPYYSAVWHARYYNKLPNSVTVYASNDEGEWEDKKWTKLGSFEQDRELETRLRWCARCATNSDWIDEYETLEELQAADPAYFSVFFPASGQGDGYRYLKIVFNDTFAAHNPYGCQNENKYLTFHEMELYTKMD